MSFLLGIFLKIPAVLLAFTVQGYAKSKVAYKLGDKAQRLQGRMNLNPINHIDPIGMLMIILIGFGWTKPLEINANSFKRYYKDDLKVRLSAPIANFITAMIFAILYGIYIKTMVGVLPETFFYVIETMLYIIISVNVSLGIFILLPLPGLEGFYIFRDLSPKKFFSIADSLIQYQLPILIGVVFLGQYVLQYPVSIIMKLMMNISLFIMGLF
ncbi:MAG: site-2 protease family protein [Clostridium sp.]